jgi:16S rRNA (cytidine1402-2'-O)-methyltransferase
MALSLGTLYIVATAIGNLTDITKRALTTLSQVAVIAAEDTRHSRTLLQHFGIETPMLSLHQHNEAQRSEQLLQRLKAGEDVALISDAGTPLISDPGSKLVQLAHQAGVKVVPIPGACALVTALSASGMPCEQFIFLGFLPAKSQQRQTQLHSLAMQELTMVFYEAPHRILALMQDCIAAFGEQREAVMARELTKLYETIQRSTLGSLYAFMQEQPQQQRGEFVVIVAGAEKKQQASHEAIQNVLTILLDELPPRQAAKLAARITHEKVNVLYQLALEQQQEKNNDAANSNG